MSRIDKLLYKFYSKPIPTDMTHEEIIALAKHFGCTVKSGGDHPIIITHEIAGRPIPVSKHGKCVKEMYIRELRILFDEIQASRKGEAE